MTEYSKYKPFVAAGKSLEILADFHGKRAAATARLQGLVEEFGAETAVAQGARVIGFAFEGSKPPEGWAHKGQIDGRPYFAPKRRKKADKAIWERMEASGIPDLMSLHQMFTGSGFGVLTDDVGSRGGTVLRYIGLEEVGDETILLVPIGREDEDDFVPPDSTAIPMSKFWAMKEDAAESDRQGASQETPNE